MSRSGNIRIGTTEITKNNHMTSVRVRMSHEPKQSRHGSQLGIYNDHTMRGGDQWGVSMKFRSKGFYSIWRDYHLRKAWGARSTPYTSKSSITKCVRDKAATSGENCRRGAVLSFLSQIEQNKTGILREDPENKRGVADG